MLSRRFAMLSVATRLAGALVVGVLTTLVVLPVPAAEAAVINDFDRVFSAQTNGSIAITGNALLTCTQFGSFNCANSLAGSGSGSTGNNNLLMVQLDADNDPTTSNSSRARLDLPAGSTVLFAGLYWGAPTTAGQLGSSAPGGTRTLKFKVPGGAYQTLAPDTQDNINGGNNDYSAFKDVTSLVRAAGAGNYWGADIKTATGADRYAGWSLVVAIGDPNAPLRDLSVFNGYYTVSGTQVVDTTISGFLTPPTGPVRAKIGTVVYEGDQHLSGDYFSVNGTRLADAESPSGNFFQSRITADGANLTDRLPASLNNLGIDAKVVDAGASLPNGATSATLRFGTNGDAYYPAVLTTQVDLFAPTIVGTKTVQNLAGNSPARVGDTLEYTLTFTNTGDDTATDAVIRDALPDNVTYVPGSLRVTAGANRGPKSDAADADQGEYDAGTDSIRVRAGPGANGTQGGRLPKNVSTTVKFRVTLDLASAGTTVENTAQLDYTAATINKPYTYDTAIVQTPVGTLADLAITKTAAPEPVAAGAELTYTLTTTNNGPNTAVNTRVVDTLPSGATFVSASPAQGNCTQASGSVSCLLGDVADGASVEVEVTVRVGPDFNGAGLTNVASVAADTSDPNTADNTASASSTVVRSADLTIAKTTSTPSPVPGTDVTYRLAVTNDGPSDAAAVVVNDDLATAFTSATATTDQGTCSVTGRSVSCSLGTVPAGATVTVTVTARLGSASTAGSVSNTATVSSPTPDPTPGNNSSTVAVTPAAPSADLRVTKETLTAPVVPGLPVQYRITVSNTGPSDASAVEVSDLAPPALQSPSATPSQGTCTAGLVCTLGTVRAGSSATITVTGTVAPSATGTITNSATATSATADPTPGNNTGSTTDSLAPSADLSISKTAAPNPVVDGTDVTYTLTVTNNGPSRAEGVEVRDPVPAPLGLESATASQGSCTTPSGEAVCDLGSLAPGGTATVTVTASTPPGGGADGVTNTATVSSDTPDPVAGNNSASTDVSADALADVSILKEASPATVLAGEQVTWTLTASNAGPSDATGVTISDSVPTSVTIDSVAPAGDCTITDQQVTCTTATLSNGGDYVVTIVGTVQPGADPGALGNTASVATQTPEDPTGSNNTSTSTTTVDTSADLALSKSASATVVAGQTLSYTLSVTNTGPSDARDVTITDDLPPGTTFVGFTGAGSSCSLQDDSTSTVECTLGTVAAGATRDVVVEVLVDASVPDGTTLDNSAQVSTTTADPVPGNDTDAASTTVETRADLGVTKVADRNRIVAGADTTYTIVVTNDGPSTAVDPQVVDSLPAGVALQEASPSAGSCVEAPAGVLTCTRPDLVPGAEWTISVRVFVDPGTLADQTNTVDVTSATTDPNAANDQAVVVSPVDAAGDLEVVKTVLPSPVVPGNQVVYTLTVANYGPADMTGVIVDDALPAGLSEATATSTAGICTVGATVSCALGTISPGATATVTITALLDDAYTDATLDNSATVSSTTRDTDGTNDTDDVSTPVEARADLSVVKRGDPVLVPGQRSDYFLEVTNNGPSTARDVSVTDQVPAGLSIVAAEVVDGPVCSVSGQAVTCDLGTVAPGRTLIRVRVRPDADLGATSVSNTARVSTSSVDPVPGNNSSTLVTPVTPSADVVLDKVRTTPTPPAPVVPGGAVAWTITVSNPDGPSTATGVVVTDQVDPALTGVTATASNGSVCTIDAGLVTCPVNVVDVGASVTVTISGTLDAAFTGTLSNTADSTTDTTDPEPGNNSSAVTDTVEPRADISVVKARTSGPVVPGTRISWTISTTNQGPSVASDVSLSDTLPDVLTGITVSPPAGVTCDLVDNQLDCELGDLDPTERVDVVVSADLPAGFVGDLVNTADVASPTDTTPGNNNNTNTGTAQPAADLSLAKTRTSGPVVPGTPISWDLTVDNLGPSVATGNQVSDDLPDALTNVTATATGGGSCTVGAGNVVTCDLPDLAPTDPAVVVTITADVPPRFTGDAANSATVSGDTPDPQPGNNTASVDGSATPQADVSITKSLTSGPAVPGQPVTWTLLVDNAGPSSAQDITVSDDVADDLTGLTATGPDGVTCTVAAGNVVTCTLPNLGPNADPVRIQLTGLLPASYTGTLSNTATVDSPTDTTPDNNTSTVTTPTQPVADVSITKTRTSGPVVPGQDVSWSITVRNSGPSTAVDVAVEDAVPAALTGVSATGGTGVTCDPVAGNLVACTIGTLPPGAVRLITVSGTLDAAFTGALDNTATVTSPTDTTPGDNTSTSTGQAAPRADVSLVKTITSGPVVPGLPVTWSLTVSNAGPSVATSVSVTDDVVDTLTGVTATSPDATCTVAADNVVDCAVADLAPGATAVVTVTGLVPPSFTGTLANTATVASPVDNTPANNTSTVTAPAQPAADVSILKQRTSGPVIAGNDVTWTITATNNGPSVARDVTVTDDADDALSNLTATTPAGDVCTITTGNRITCDLGDQPRDAVVTITVTATVPPGYTGDLDNTATITSPTDNTPGNNTSTSSGAVDSQANVSIIKARTSGPVVPGQSVTWTLTVDNVGPSTATAVSVTDAVSASLTDVVATVAAPATCTVAADNGVACDLGSVDPADDPIVITITGSVPAGFAGTLDNTATVAADNDTDPADNTSTTEGSAAPEADVSIIKTRTSGPVVPGQDIAWDIVVTNNGPSVARNVQVTDDVADEVRGLTVTATGGGDPAPACTVAPGNRISCALGAVDPSDDPVVITVTGRVPAGFTGDLDNTATVTSPTDTTPDNNTSTVDGPAEPDADVAISKLRTSGPVTPGSPVTWDVVVTNSGPSVATDVSVSDDLADALDDVTATLTGGGASSVCTVATGNVVTCDLGSLAPGDEVVITLTGALPAGFTGDLDNTAEVSSPVDTTPGNNTSTVPGTAVPSADVSITKARTSGTITPGQDVSWDLTVTNTGPSVATDVTVDDNLNDALTGVTATVAGDLCTVATGNVVTCDLGDLAPGETVVVTVTGTLPADFTGDLTNSATVNSPTDTTPANNTSTVPGTAVPNADVSITKTLTSATITPGQDVTWEVTVTNDGPSLATDVTVDDDLNDALTGLTATVTGDLCTVATGNVVTCDLGDLAPGETVTITLTGSVPADYTGDLDNTATVDSPTDTTPANNTSTAPGTAIPAADVSITKTLTSAPITPGQDVTWDLTITNAGPSLATDVTVTDNLVNALTNVSATITSGAAPDLCTIAAGNNITCDLGDLAPATPANPAVIITITGTLPPDYTGDLDNTAVVDSPTDTTPANNTSTAPGTAVPAADVSITKTLTSTPITPGQDVTWDIVVRNGGPSVATGVTVTDDLADELTGVTATVPGDLCTVDVGNAVTCDLGSLGTEAPDNTLTITVTGSVPADYTGSLDNTSTVTSPTDTTPGNNTSTAPGTAVPDADVSIDKTRTTGPVTPGRDVSWDLVVSNDGPSTATDVTVTDDLADELTGVTAEVPGDLCTVATGNVVTCGLGSLDPGESVTITVTGSVPTDFTGDLDNTSTVTSPTDTTPGNNTSTAPGTAVPDADVSIDKTRTTGAVTPGQDVSWDLVVSNDGPSTATDVTVTDDLNDELTGVTATAPGDLCSVATGNVVTCDVAVLAPGESVTITVTGSVPADYTGDLDNTAVVDSPTDTTPGNNTSTQPGTAVPDADVSIAKARTSGPVVPGAVVTWELTVTNDGPSTATVVTVTDDVPDDLTGVTATVAGDLCTVADDSSVSCDLGALAPDESVVITVSGTLPAGFVGDLVNTADVASPTDTTPGNNTDTNTGTAQPAADLSLAKTRTSGPVVPGTPISWDLTVDNLGPSVATGNQVSDDLPDALTNVTATATGGGSCTVGAGNVVTCDLPDLAPTDPAVVVTITADVPPRFTGDAANSATVSGDTPDPQPGNNTASVDGSATPQADVSITKSLTSGPAVPGQPVTWTLLVDNAGPSSAQDITVSDDVADDLTGLTATGPDGVTCTVAAGNVVTCTLPNLGPNADPVRIQLTGLLPASYTGTLSNTATVDSPTDTTPDNNTSTVTTPTQPVADVSITKTRTSGPVVPGQDVSWDLEVRNAGPSTAQDLTVTDDVPAALSGLTLTTGTGVSCEPVSGNAVSCTVATLPPGGLRTITITGSLDADFTGTLSNTSTVDSPTDTTPDNNTSTSSGTAAPTADVSLVKTITSGPVVPGTPVTWTLSATNAGPSVATDLTLADDVVDDLTGVSASTPDGTCTVGDDNVVTCDLADLAPGATTLVTITGLVPPGFTGTLANTATVASPTDNTPANNTSTVTAPAQPAADVSILKQRTSGPVIAGNDVTWTITATNNGPSVARDVTVTDDADDALSNLTATTPAGDVCTITTGNRITCDLGDQPRDAVVTITVTATVPPGYTGDLDNTATITSPTDNTPGNNTSTSSGAVDSQANVSIIKARTSGPVVPGQPITWTLTIDNAGPSVATDTTVTDALDPALTDVVVDAPTGTTCTVGTDNALSCDVGSVDPSDDPVVIEVTASVPSDFTGPLDNTAVVTSPTDTDEGDNTSTTDGDAAPEADVSIIKSRTSGPVVPGQDIAWDIVVTNNGPSVARNVRVTDRVPGSVTGLDVAVVGSASPTATCSVGGGNRITCDLGDLDPADGPVTLRVTGRVPADFTGDLDNTATVTSPTDTTPDNNTTTVPGPAVPDADVAIAKARTSGPITPGSRVTWDVTVTNAGPSVATDVIVTDDLADALTDVSTTLTGAVTGDRCTVATGNVMTCDLGDLAPGETVVVTVTGTLPADYTGDLTNTATVDSPTDTTPDNNTSTTPGTAVPSADVSITKARTSGTITPGQDVSWDLTVTNTGPSVATDVTVDDDVNDALTGLTATVTGDLCTVATGNVVTCDLGDLAPGETVVVTVTGTLPADFTGDLTNSATVNSPTDTTPANNTSTAPGTAVPAADVSITKTLTSATITPGQDVTWEVTVTNDGPSLATDVTVDDDLNDALTGLTATVTGDLCTVATGNVVSCDLGDLAPGETVTITLTGSVPADYTGDLDNTATVDSPTDTTPANNTSTVPGTAIPAADVSITKTRTTDPITPGQDATWDIVVRNDGPSLATGVTVTDDLADELTGVTATVPGDLCTVDVGNAVTCDLGSLDPGESVTITVTGTLPPDYTGDLDNTAVVDSPTDTTPANNTSTAPGTAVPAADLSIIKTTDRTPVPGERASWTLSISNDGPSVATAVIVGDRLDLALSDIRTEAPAGVSCDVGSDNLLTCTLDRLAPGDPAVEIVVSGLLDPEFRGDLANTATVSSAVDEVDPTDNSSSVSHQAEPEADLSVTKSVSPRRPLAGDTVTYTIEVANAGPSSATDVVVTDPLDDRLRAISADLDSRGDCTVGRDKVVTCTIASIAAGDTATVTITAKLSADLTGAIANTATVTGGPETDPTPGDLTDTVTTGPVRGADLQVTKQASDDEVTAGRTVRYDITVANLGPATAADVRLVDELPDELTLVSVRTDTGTCREGRTVQCRLGDLAAGDVARITVRATVDEDARGRIVNTATATSDTSDPRPGNNDDAEPIRASAPADVGDDNGTQDPDGGAPGSGDGLPDTGASALTTWGLWAGLAMLLAGLGLVASGRRRSRRP